MTDEEIAEQIERLRGGADLDPKSVKAVAVGIARRFTELAELWGDKRFFIEAAFSVPMENWYLGFSKRTGTWEFLILQDPDDPNSQMLKISEAPLGHRLAAAECLPDLEDTLVDIHKVDRQRLIAAIDTLTKLSEGHGQGVKDD